MLKCHRVPGRYSAFANSFMYVLLLPVAIFWGCSSSVMVRVPPRMDLTGYQTMGIIQFASNADATINQYATQQFQEHVQAAQPGTRFIELGTQESVLAAIGAKQLDVDAIKKVGEKYGVAAVFHGNIAYSEPRTDIRVSDVTKLQGGVQSEIKGDIFSKLVETRTGASVWSSSAWATKPIGGLVSGEQGVAVAMRKSNPRFEMIPSMVYHLTTDFRESTVRQRVK